MEEEKKKKRNKKKKSKQNRTTDGPASGAEESTSGDQKYVLQNDRSQESESGDVQNDGAAAPAKDVGFDRSHVNGTEVAILRERVDRLRMENDALIQKEGILNKIVKQLQNEKDAYMQKEASFSEQINKFQREKGIHDEKEALLEMKISQLQIEKDLWLEKEVSLDGKMNQLMDESATLNLKVDSLEGKVKQLEQERESSLLEVLKLEESRTSLIQANHQLTEKISILQSQIQSLESSISHSSIKGSMHSSENGDIDTQIEAAGALIDKLINENAELIEKVNELYFKLDQRSMTTMQSSSVESPLDIVTSEPSLASKNSASGYKPVIVTSKRYYEATQGADPMPQSVQKMSVSGEIMQPPEVVIEDKKNATAYLNAEDNAVAMNSPEIAESEEVVQIPLDESDIHDSELEAADENEKDDIPLTDAPLIGAPFRFVSFVARYVSGADLVN